MDFKTYRTLDKVGNPTLPCKYFLDVGKLGEVVYFMFNKQPVFTEM